MGQFFGVILCICSAFIFHECENYLCLCSAMFVGIVCLWSWYAIRSPSMFDLTGKWQRRLQLTLMNSELYHARRNGVASTPLYHKNRKVPIPDWIVVVNLLFTVIGLGLFCWAVQNKFFPA